MRRTLALLLFCAVAAGPAEAALSKGDYERRMQSRTATFAPQCYADDPGAAQREKIARWQRIVRELESIAPPAEIAQAHRRLTESERLVLATLRKFLPEYDRLAQLIRRARADGKFDNRESERIGAENRRLLFRALPPRRASRLRGQAFREFRRKKYDVMEAGPPKREYERRVQAIIDRAGTSSRSVRRTTSAGDLRSQLVRAREVTFRAARALATITPREDVINAQSRLVGGLCMRARTYAGYAETLKTRRDARTVRVIVTSARDADRIFRVYVPAVEDYREAGYRIRPPR